MHPDRYQIVLIILGIAATALFFHFLVKEANPEYLIYQDDYIALEEFRSQYTHEPPPAFKRGVKQIVFERDDKGPAKIDRCTSCHAAMELVHFSPTTLAHDINGNIVRDLNGTPVKIPNKDYVWKQLETRIEELRDEKVLAHMREQGDSSTAEARLKEARSLEALKTAKIGEHTYDVTKVLAMHPLIGKETRPFEFHPLEDYGCTTCHSGNGRGLTTPKAHGPVFDGEYEVEFMGPKKEFIEKDPGNDPRFAKVFNDKPGDALLFQTTPILVGNLIQSSCVQCHLQSSAALQGVADTAGSLASKRTKQVNAMKAGFEDDQEALLSLMTIERLIEKDGIAQAVASLKQQSEDPARLAKDRGEIAKQVEFLEEMRHGKPDETAWQKAAQAAILAKETVLLGNQGLVETLKKALATGGEGKRALANFLKSQQGNAGATGTLFVKLKMLELQNALLAHIEDAQDSFSQTASDETVVNAMTSDIDWLTKNYQKGHDLYLSQACYACHRIAGMARGGIGPELTLSGNSYPWYLKESIVWPQADLPTSTMPNFMLDHVELEDLMTFLLAQKGPGQKLTQTEYKVAIQEWEASRNMPWEKPVPPSMVHDLRYAMTVFATEGCAACHRLEGFDSDVGFAVEKKQPVSFDALYGEKEWFRTLFPEDSRGSSIVKAIEANAEEIDKRIVAGVSSGSILEEIEKKHPETIEGLYSNFRYAARAHDREYKDLAEAATDPKEKEGVLAKLAAWKERVHRILMVYVEEYGLGRLIGPRPNWSGVYRSDEWLIEHFRNPASHVPRSIMPVFPFDETKFYTLTYMLDVLGKRNRDALREVWNRRGFNAEQAYQLLCSQCHGPYMQGDGPVATWIYPIPKNLRNAEFMRNLTRENVIQSITHGVKGTPMPPWGEVPEPKPNYDGIPVLNEGEIHKLVDWLYSSLPGSTVIKGVQDVPKWHYTPKDVIEELQREGGELTPKPVPAEPKLGKCADAVPFLSVGTTCEIYFAANDVNARTDGMEEDLAEGVFDVVPNTLSGGEPNAYYIKKKYYTKENLEKGREFFELNCAVCHGKEADGMGARSSVMIDAKPRMLTNLDWLKTRDDLRLLRSIKYGVQGTAMTPWGDLTSSLQRLQLVMFIRSLSEEKERREALAEALYRAFDTTQVVIEQARIKEYAALEEAKMEWRRLRKELRVSAKAGSENDQQIDKALVLYKQQLLLGENVKKRKRIDRWLSELKGLVGKQRELFYGIGNDMITAEVTEECWQTFLQIIGFYNDGLVLNDNILKINGDWGNQQKIQTAASDITALIDKASKGYEKEKVGASGPAAHQLDAEMAALAKVKARLLSGLTESQLLLAQAKELIDKIDKDR